MILDLNVMMNQYKYVIGIKQNNTHPSILDISNVGPNPTDNAWTDMLFKILFNFVYTEFMTDFAISATRICPIEICICHLPCLNWVLSH